MVGLERCLPRSVKISILADDISMWCPGHNRPVVRPRLLGALNSVAKFLAIRGLEILPFKCAAMAFTKWDISKHNLTVAGVPIPYVNHHQFLGVTFDRHLTGIPHVCSLTKKLESFASIIGM